MLRICPHCGREALFTREAVYDGFTKIGERMTCTSCGEGDLAPLGKESAPGGKDAEGPGFVLPDLFSEDDLPEKPKLFAEGEGQAVCHRCRHYYTDPFRQRCLLHDRDTEALDTCPDFARKAD